MLSHKKLSQIFSFILSVTGLLICCYLFYQHYLIINEANGKADVCYAVFGKGCARALSSKVAVQLGLPLAGWGIIYYVLLIALLSVYSKNKFHSTAIFLFSFSLLAAIGSILLLMMIYFDHALFCPFCVMIHGINLLLFFCMVRLTDFSFSKKHANTEKEKKIKWITTAFFFLVIILLYAFLKTVVTSGKIIFDAERFVKEFDNTPQQKIIFDDDDPVSGPVNAAVQVIVFSDFECPACRNFSNVISVLKKNYPNSFLVVFKNFPLGKQCNPIFGDYDLHPKACEAARAAEAARLQGKFWQYHDLLFSIDLEETNETFSSLAAKAGLNTVQFEHERKGELVVDNVAKTINQGDQLGIKGTPAVFLNGRAVSDSRLRHMQVLMDHVLKKSL